MSSTRGLLLDLDDTLYDYAPAELHARAGLFARVASDTGLKPERVAALYDAARKSVKARVGERGASHSRLLYLLELAHLCGAREALAHVRAWERLFWQSFLQRATLRAGALTLLTGWRAQGHRVAVVTDLTAEVQLWKLEAFALFPHIDALVVSEEVAFDKPDATAFTLAITRLGVAQEDCVVVGDSERKDGGGARALGLPFLRVQSTEPGDQDGLSLEEVARKLGVLS